MRIKAYLHKVQYYETDQMRVVHHSNYIRWFEESRVDFMEQIGLDYDTLERDGYISPVTSVKCDYKNMVKFGDSVYIITKLEKFNGITFSLTYKVIDSVTRKLRAIGESNHCFINGKGKLISLKKENAKYYGLFLKAVGKEME